MSNESNQTSNRNSNRTYGPLTPLHVKMLTEKLDGVGSVYRIFTDDDLMNQAQVRKKNSPEASPFFHNTPGISMKEYLYIEIALKDLMLIRADLIKLGFESTQDPSFDEALQAEEFICPECSFVQNSRGLCHKHQIPLIPYYEKALGHKKIKERKFWIVILIFIAIIAAAIIYSKINKN